MGFFSRSEVFRIQRYGDFFLTGKQESIFLAFLILTRPMAAVMSLRSCLLKYSRNKKENLLSIPTRFPGDVSNKSTSKLGAAEH